MATPTSPTAHHDARQHAPAAERNQQPILDVLKRHLPAQGLVLEIAAGTGQHAAFFSRYLPALRWQPSDADAQNLPSIQAWGEAEGGALWQPPILLDVTQEDWGIESLAAILCINMIHISPWEACIALCKGAGALLSKGGVLVLYGPYRVEGVPTAESNENFDQWLKSRDPAWGLRMLGDVVACANEHGLHLVHKIEMPANNLSLILHKS